MDRHLIILDSNAIIGNNYTLDIPSINSFVINKFNVIAISDVVRKEVISNYKKEQLHAFKKIEEALEKGEKLGIKYSSEPVNTYDFEMEFNDWVDKLNINIIGFNEADLEFILNKAIALEKPFKNKNSKESGGIKDAIIWSSLLNYLSENSKKFDKIVFVNNDSDFIDHKNLSLHKELIEDLKLYSIEHSNVEIVKSIKDLVKLVIQPTMPKIHQAIKDSIVKDLKYLKFDLVDIIEAKMSDLELLILDKLEQILGSSAEPEFNFTNEFPVSSPIEVNIYNNETGYVYFTKDFEIEAEYFVLKGEYLYISEEREVNIIDPDWNKWVYWVSEIYNITVSYETTFSLDNGEALDGYVIDIEFDGVQIITEN